MSRFGNLVETLRKERGLTQDQVAKKIGSHKGYVCGIEKDKVNPPSVKIIKKFAKLFGQDERMLVRLAWVDKAPAIIREDAERFLEWIRNAQGSGPLAVPPKPESRVILDVEGRKVSRDYPAGLGSSEARRMGDPNSKPTTPVILLVEPNRSFSSLMASILQKEGFGVMAAKNSDEALELCSDVTGIALLVVDVVLPRESGMDLANRLKKDHPGMKVLYLSSITEPELRAQGIGDDAHVLVKPLALSDLVSTVNSMLSSRPSDPS